MSTFTDKDSAEQSAAPLWQLTNELGWTNCMGFPKARPTIRNILCLKFDHIGDILVADFSFRLIERYFPDASVTLICGEWNVDLAEELGIADTVIGVSLFHQQGADQHNEKIALAARAAGITRLLQIAQSLPEFDLAIDMRIDEDTRDLLKFFKSKVYVGSGDLTKYPFLDISVPQSEVHDNLAPSRFRLMPRDFTGGHGYEITSYGIGFTSTVLSLPIKFEIDGVKTPIECGTSADDNRMLGIGIKSISVVCNDLGGGEILLKEFTFEENSPDRQFLSQGWANSESWGTWNDGVEATIVLSNTEGEIHENLSLLLEFRAHTNETNKQVTVKCFDITSTSTASITCEYPDSEFELLLPVVGKRRFGFARTRPVGLRAGRHSIRVETFIARSTHLTTLKLTILGTKPERTIESLEIGSAEVGQQRKTFTFEIDHRDSDEPIQIQIEAGSSGSPFGFYVMAISSDLIQGAPARVPASHMEKLIARLVMSAALEFSPVFADLYEIPEGRFKKTNEALYASDNQALSEYINNISERKLQFKIVGLSIGATKETKKWPFSYILELCELLLSRADVFLVLVGGPSDVSDTQILERTLQRPERVLNVCGKNKLAEFGAIIDPMDLYVGFDTGTTHYAGKVGVRTIGIFAAVHSPREWGPVGRRASWITHYTDCSPCYLAKLDQCRHGHACMLELFPSDCWRIISNALDGDVSVNAEIGSHSEGKQLVSSDAVYTQFDASAQNSIVDTERVFSKRRLTSSQPPTSIPTQAQQILYEIGRTYRAGIDPEFSNAFIDGWFALEAGGIWCGMYGHARFAYLKSEFNVELEIHCRVNSDKDSKLIYVSLDSTEKAIGFLSGAWETKVIQNKPRAFDGICVLDLVFKCPDATSPIKVGASLDDERTLGLMIASFSLV